MKLVIEIDDDTYKRVISDSKTYVLDEIFVENAIYNGTPLDDVLDKIKAEVREFSFTRGSGTYHILTYIVNQIIDKYKAKSEE